MLEKPRKKLAILISGRGSNMEAILHASQDDDYPAEICLVLADNHSAKGLETAKSQGIPVASFERGEFSSKQLHEAKVIQAIQEADADFVILAGYMRLLSAHFVDLFKGKLINIHPSLLPEFKGLDTHSRAIEAGVSEHGCTVHFVNSEMDGGQIIAQRKIAVCSDDTPDSLTAKVLHHEHELYPKVIALLTSGKIALGADGALLAPMIERCDKGYLLI